MQHEIYNMFAIPLYCGKVNITDEEHRCITERIKYESNGNYGTAISSDRHLERVKDEQLLSLHKKINDHACNFVYDVLNITRLVRPRFIASWALKIGAGQSQPQHNHMGSMLSGVLYVQSEEGAGGIVFGRPHSLFGSAVEPEFVAENQFNSGNSVFEPKTGDILIFPSDLYHGVLEHKGNKERFSVAFDIFLEGRYCNNMHDKVIRIES